MQLCWRKLLAKVPPQKKKKSEDICTSFSLYLTTYLGYISYYHRVYLLLGECYMVFQTWDYLQNRLNSWV